MTGLQKLEQKVADMQTAIELMKAEEAKPKKFEFKYPKGCYMVNMNAIHMGGGETGSYLEYGRYRLTEGVAKQSLTRNKRANGLEALAEMLGGLQEFEYGKENYFVYYSNFAESWRYRETVNYFYPEVVYITEECALEICRMFNEGEFEL